MRPAVREATWFVEPTGEGRIVPRRSKGRWRERFAETAFAAAPPFLALLSPFWFSSESLAVFAWVAVAAWPLAAAFRLARKQDAQAREYDAIRKEFGDVYGHLVSMVVREGDAPTGEDQGVLWVEDGHLYFSGRRTSFGLVPSQVLGECRIQSGVDRVRYEVEVGLRPRTAIGGMAVTFRPVLLPRETPHRAFAALKREIDRWLTGPESGTGQLPPVGLGPGVIGERRLALRAVGATLPRTALVGLLAHAWAQGHTGTAILVSLCVCAGMVPGSNLRWRALRDRRRLRRMG